MESPFNIALSKGLDIPISGKPEQKVWAANAITEVALLGQDYVGLKPSMAVRVGDKVAAGDLLFTDKKNPGVRFTAPAAGIITAIHRGPRRRFESLVIQLQGEEQRSFLQEEELFSPVRSSQLPDADTIKNVLLESGQWTALRKRPYGKIPSPEASPSSLFITAMDTEPLAPDPAIIIHEYPEAFQLGLQVLQSLAPRTLLCCESGAMLPGIDLPGIEVARFAGPHPAGLPSTHIHFLDPVQANKEVWHIGYQEVIAIGQLFRTGALCSERIIALTGPAMLQPRLVRTQVGASVTELCHNELVKNNARLIAGSVLSGHCLGENNIHGYPGRYQQQISALPEKDGSGFLSWLQLGKDRYSSLPIFLSSFMKRKSLFPMTTAAWGGHRAILPIGTYEKVMPLNLIATALLKTLATGNTEKAAELGCLELVEEDLALSSFVCPGKNNFGPMLRSVLTKIEEDG